MSFFLKQEIHRAFSTLSSKVRPLIMQKGHMFNIEKPVQEVSQQTPRCLGEQDGAAHHPNALGRRECRYSINVIVLIIYLHLVISEVGICRLACWLCLSESRRGLAINARPAPDHIWFWITFGGSALYEASRERSTGKSEKCEGAAHDGSSHPALIRRSAHHHISLLDIEKIKT